MNNVINRVLENLDASARGTDKALGLLLKTNIDCLPEFNIEMVIGNFSRRAHIGDFHYAFRRWAVTGNGDIDMAIWWLIDESAVFWDTLNQIADEQGILNKNM